MASSMQTAVSDGTLTTLALSIEYFERSEITVYFNGNLTVDWAWVGDTSKTITFLTQVPAGVTVLVRRTTDLTQLRHKFSAGAAFTATTLDEDLTQVLHIVQESLDGSDTSEVVNLDQKITQLRADLGSTSTGKGDDMIVTAPAPGGLWTTVRGFIATLLGTTGASIVGFIQDAYGAVARSTQSKLRERKSVFDFMTTAQVADVQSRTAALDVTAAMHLARDWLAASKGKLVFPAGDYKYSVSPNWAITNAEVVADGEVKLIYTGTGDAVTFDAGTLPADLCYDLKFGVGNKFHVCAPATAMNGVYVRSVHHSKIGANVHGAGALYAGLAVQFAVVTEFDVVVSGNEGGWYLGAKPTYGYNLQQRLPGETTSYCYFPNPIVEGVPLGIQLLNTLGNVFVGGTSEGCSEYGVYASPGSNWDRFTGTDFEVNTIADIYCLGIGVEFIGCDTYDSIVLGGSAKRCIISGGGHENITVDTGAQGCSVVNATYNRLGTGGTLTDDGSNTEIANVRSGVAPYAMALTGTAPILESTVAPGAAAVVTVTVAGAKVGDFVQSSCTSSLQNLSVSAVVTSPGIATFYAVNNVTGAPVTILAGTVKCRVTRGM